MSTVTRPPKPRRFYVTAGVAESEDGGFMITLDGRGARTPGASPLVLPSAGLADLVASEWASQGETLDWALMPATRLAAIAVDGGGPGRARAMETIIGYAASDLVCYFATHPRSLVERQTRVWGGLLDWARDAHGLAFARASGIIHQAQPPETLAKLESMLDARDDFTLTGLAFGAPLFGSAILTLALAQGRLDAEAATAAARLDETFQEEQWGVDAESARRARLLAADAGALERWFRALV